VFVGIGEFTIHKEFVSSKVAGDTASLTDPALDRILAFAGEAGLVVLLHNDIDMPFARAGAEPVYLSQTKDLLRRHANASIIWAHTGLGRVIHPTEPSASVGTTERSPSHLEIIDEIIDDPTLAHVHFDISWDEVAKYVIATPEATQRTADLINRHADRFLFGTDEVAPSDQQTYLRVYRQYDPLWRLLTPEAQALVKRGNYERLFDAARTRVRAWERANVVGAAAQR
jgi:predicted TIM-barrel fold metal-dependent hydrolase